ncbi:hypothetical protein TIFTF001_041463, partial [Ficus carica]
MDPPDPNDDVFGLFTSATGTGSATTTNLHSSSDRRFVDSSDDEEDEQDLLKNGDSSSMESASKRLDYMLQFLDRKLSLTPHHSPPSNSFPTDAVPLPNPLPELIARGGGSGIFRLPVRAAVHPHRPFSLEVRPHPLREAQIGRFLRSIAATSSHLWAATECGLRRWELTDLYAAAGEGDDHEDAVPFKESVGTSPALCLAADEGARVVWSGHRDGRIRCWRMDENGDAFKEALSWLAQKAPVLSLVITAY